MTSWDELGPFQPGPGGMPPYLAGRETEQRFFRALLRRLEQRMPLPGEVILCGPRGNGKTVLLGWLRQEAASLGAIETVALLPSEIRDRQRLAELLRPARWWRWFVPGQVGAYGVSWAKPTTGVAPSPVSANLAARTRKSPLLVVMDEAHTLDIEVGQALLNAAQEVRQRLPLLLVLAGTPNIEGHLGSMGASFWNRAEHLRIGRLDDAAAAEAFGRPFATEGVEVEEAVLMEVVRLSHGYPYFLQLLGRAAWGAAFGPDGGGRVTVAALEAALPAFEKTRGHYYRHRYDELRKQGLLAVGRCVARAFDGREFLTDEILTQAVRAGIEDPSDVRAASRAEGILSDLGFIWRTSPTPGWEPGIPSLMDYIVEFTATA